MGSMSKILPTASYVLIKFLQAEGAPEIILPSGQNPTSGDIVVVEVGPDVPQVPPIGPGTRVHLRGDAKIFGLDTKKHMAVVPYAVITAVMEPDEVVQSLNGEVSRALELAVQN